MGLGSPIPFFATTASPQRQEAVVGGTCDSVPSERKTSISRVPAMHNVVYSYSISLSFKGCLRKIH
jgi:hypothetical protein